MEGRAECRTPQTDRQMVLLQYKRKSSLETTCSTRLSGLPKAHIFPWTVHGFGVKVISTLIYCSREAREAGEDAAKHPIQHNILSPLLVDKDDHDNRSSSRSAAVAAAAVQQHLTQLQPILHSVARWPPWRIDELIIFPSVSTAEAFPCNCIRRRMTPRRNNTTPEHDTPHITHQIPHNPKFSQREGIEYYHPPGGRRRRVSTSYPLYRVGTYCICSFDGYSTEGSRTVRITTSI